MNIQCPCGSAMLPASAIGQFECLGCNRTMSAQDAYAEHRRNLKPFDFVQWISDDINALYEQGRAVSAHALVYLTSPVASEAARRAVSTLPRSGEPWLLFTAAGPVEVREDANHPLHGATRMWRCACSALFADNDHRTGECQACMRRRRNVAAGLFDPSPADMRRWSIALDRGTGARTMVRVTAGPTLVADPLDVEIDGVALRRLLEMDENRRTERIVGVILSPAQRAAVSAHWSAELSSKVAASKITERNRVTITHDED